MRLARGWLRQPSRVHDDLQFALLRTLAHGVWVPIVARDVCLYWQSRTTPRTARATGKLGGQGSRVLQRHDSPDQQEELQGRRGAVPVTLQCFDGRQLGIRAVYAVRTEGHGQVSSVLVDSSVVTRRRSGRSRRGHRVRTAGLQSANSSHQRQALALWCLSLAQQEEKLSDDSRR